MPSCFLALLRHTLRVDGKLVQQREVRIFHKFGSPVIIRSHRLASKPLPPLPRPSPGAPPMPPPPFLRRLDETSIAEMLASAPATESVEEVVLSLEGGVPAALSPTLRAPIATLASASPSASTAMPRPSPSRPPLPLGEPSPRAPRACTVGCRPQPCDRDSLTRTHTQAPMTLRPLPLPVTPLPAPVSTLRLDTERARLAAGDYSGGLLVVELTLPAAPGAASVPDAPEVEVATSPPTASPPGCHELWRAIGAHGGAVTALCFAPYAAPLPAARRPLDDDALGWTISAAEDGTCTAWHTAAVDATRADGNVLGTSRQRVRSWPLDCPSADRVFREGLSYAVVQLLAVEPPTEPAATPATATASGATACRFAAAVGSSIFLLSTDQTAPCRRLAAGRTVTALQYLTGRRSLCASGYGGVMVWAEYGHGGAASILPYKGPLDTMAVPRGEGYVACGAQDATLVMWPVDSSRQLPPAGLCDGQPVTDMAAAQANEAGGETASERESATVPSAPVILPLPPPQAPPDVTEAASEAEAAQRGGAALHFSGGCYEQKVGPLTWDPSGRLCASAGGKHVVLWDLGPAGTPPPVRQNGRAILLRGHQSAVTWLGFESSRPDGHDAVDGEGLACARSSPTLAASAADGRLWMTRVEIPEQPDCALQQAQVIYHPEAATSTGAVSRESPCIWGSDGLLFCSKAGQLLALRRPWDSSLLSPSSPHASDAPSAGAAAELGISEPDPPR